MDEPRYIKNYSIEELEKELARRKLAAVTPINRSVQLYALDGSKAEGLLLTYEDKPYPIYVVWRNQVYRFEHKVSFSGAIYNQIEALIVTVKEVS